MEPGRSVGTNLSDTPDFLAVMGGLVVNPRLQPLDDKDCIRRVYVSS